MSNGALSWTDCCKDDIDGVPELAGNAGTSVLAYDAAYPGANALTADPTQVAKINYTRNASANLDIDVICTFSATNNKTIRVLAALNVLLPSAVVQVTCRVQQTAGTVVAAATAYSAAQLVVRPLQTGRYDLFWIVTPTGLAAAANFRFRFPASTSGSFEIGRLWAGDGLVWSNGVGADWGMYGVDGSRVIRPHGGGFSAYAFPVSKGLRLTKRGLSYAETFGNSSSLTALSVRNLLFEAGMSEPVVAISTDRDQHSAQVLSVYGLVAQLPDLDHLSANKYGTAIAVQQIR